MDFIDEDALLEPAVLNQYKIVFVSEPNVPLAGQRALLQFAEAGGTVWLSGAGAVRDEYNEASSVFDVAAKLSSPAPPKVTLNAWSGVPTGSGEGGFGAFVSWGPRTAVQALGPRATTQATFKDGSPAVVSTAVGVGRVVRYMWSLGYTWNANGWKGGADKYLRGELEAMNITRPVWTNIKDCRKDGGVHRGVETSLLLSGAGAAVTVMNWCGNDMVTHADISVELDFIPASVFSCMQKRLLPHTTDGEIYRIYCCIGRSNCHRRQRPQSECVHALLLLVNAVGLTIF